MKTAVLSDIHANLEAFEAVRAVAEERSVDRWACLGDLVGYGADPNACVERVRTLTDCVVMGNHDSAVAGLQDLQYFNRHARNAVLWTREHLNQDNRDYLAQLPYIAERGESFYVHAEPVDPGNWGYVDTRQNVATALAAVTARFCFIGHSHQAFAYVAAGSQLEIALETSGRLQLQDGSRYLVNAGSVGQPRDGEPRACFALCDDEAETIELVRTDYDIARAQEKILEAGLPAFLATRLQNGH